MLVGLLTALLVFVSVVLIVLIVALQHGNEGGIGSAFGGGNSAGFFGASGGVALIVRATWIFGAAFFTLSTALAWVKTYEKFGVTRELESSITEEIKPLSDTANPAPSTESPASPVAPVQPEATAGSADGSVSSPEAPASQTEGGEVQPVQPAQ